MKKILLVTLLSLLTSCAPIDPSLSTSEPLSEPEISAPTNENETSSLPSEEESTTSEEKILSNLNVFISEVYASEDELFGKAIEIANVGEKINLNGYKVCIYSGLKLSKEIILEDISLDTNETYVIANKTNDVYDYHSVSNMILDGDYITGSNCIELYTPNDEIFDVVGSSYRYKYAIYSSYIRLPSSYKSNPIYDQLGFVNIRVDENYSYLGNLNSPFSTAEDYLSGPTITESMFANDFEYGGAPGGGFVEVTVKSYGDGDTTIFDYGNTYSNVDRYESTRYMYINTPEISHAGEPGKEDIGAEPWGYAAKTFNNNKLKSATKILVQSVKGGSFRESYGRLLGFVWYATVKNPQLSDFKLLNYELILEGYANLGAEDDLKELYSEYSYYKSYFEFAFLWAQKSGIKIHGEIDPDFEY